VAGCLGKGPGEIVACRAPWRVVFCDGWMQLASRCATRLESSVVTVPPIFGFGGVCSLDRRAEGLMNLARARSVTGLRSVAGADIGRMAARKLDVDGSGAAGGVTVHSSTSSLRFVPT
jgi:hypothetical protein